MAIRDMTPKHAGYITVSTGSSSRADAKADFMSPDPILSIQEAIDYIEANSVDGGTVFIRAGTYTFTSNAPLTITNDNINIIGESREVVIAKDLVGTNVHNSVFFDINGEGCSIQNLTIDYNTNTRGNAAIDMVGVTTVEGCLIKGVRVIGGTTAGQDPLNGGVYCTVEDCLFSSSNAANALTVWATLTDNVTFVNNVLESNGANNWGEVLNATAGSNWEVRGNKIYIAHTNFIFATNGLSESVISDNLTTAATGGDFINLGYESAGLIISGNNVNETTVDSLVSFTLGNAGATIANQNINIINNTIANGGLLEIDLTATDAFIKNINNWNIAGNTVNCAGDLPIIYINGTVGDSQTDYSIRNFKVEENTIVNSGGEEFVEFRFTGDAQTTARAMILENISISNNSLKNTSTGLTTNGMLFNFNDGLVTTTQNIDYTITGFKICDNLIDIEDTDALDAIKFQFNNHANLNSFNISDIKINGNTIDNGGDGGIVFELAQAAGVFPIAGDRWSFNNNIITCTNGHGIDLTASNAVANVISRLSFNGNIIDNSSNAHNAIELNENMDYITVVNNQLLTAAGASGISFTDSGITYVTMLGNEISGATTEVLFNAAAMTVANEPGFSIWREGEKAPFVTVGTGVTGGQIDRADFENADPYISVQAAIDYLEATTQGGGTVFIKSGTYEFTTNHSITLTNDNINIIGESWDTIIQKDTGAGTHNTSMFDVNGNGCSFQNIRLDYNGSTQVNYMIDMAGVSALSGCQIKNVFFGGLNTTDQYYLASGDYINVEHCVFDVPGGANRGGAWYSASSNDCKISNCSFGGTGGAGFSTALDLDNAVDWTISDNNVIAGSTFLNCNGANQITVVGNNFSTKFPIVLTSVSRRIVISGNFCTSASEALVTWTPGGSNRNEETFVIDGNIVTDGVLLDFDMIDTSNSYYVHTGIVISNNSVQNSSTDPAIELEFTLGDSEYSIELEDVNITGNTFENTGNAEFIKLHCTSTTDGGARTMVFNDWNISNNTMVNTSTAHALNGILFDWQEAPTAGTVDWTFTNLSINNNIINMEDSDALDAIKFNISNNATLNSFALSNVDITDNTIENAGDGGIDITMGANVPAGGGNVFDNWDISRNIIDCNAGHCILWSSGNVSNVTSNFKINDNIFKPQLAESVEYGVQWYDNCERLEVCRNTYEGKFVGIWVSASDNNPTAAHIYDLKVNDNTIECLANTLGNPGIMIQTAAAGNCDRVQCCRNHVTMTTTATGVYQKAIQFGEIASAGDFTDVQINENHINIEDTGGGTGRVHKPLYIAGDLVGYQINSNYIYLSATHADVDVYGISIENPDNATTKGTVNNNTINFAMGSPDVEVGIYIAGTGSIKTSLIGNCINLDDGTARYGIQWGGASTGFNAYPNYISGATAQYWYNGAVDPPAAGADFQGTWWFEDNADGTKDQIWLCLQSDANAWNFVEIANGGA